MALDRAPLRRIRGLRFAKLLGTGHGRTFTSGDADPRHWALLASWDTAADRARLRHAPRGRAGTPLAEERWRADLRPLSSRGLWSGRTPFGDPRPSRTGAAGSPDGPIAVLTRARLAPAGRHLLARRAAGRRRPATSPGLRFARGIGEAPLGLQATFSVWDDVRRCAAFAYDGPAHRDAIADTRASAGTPSSCSRALLSSAPRAATTGMIRCGTDG